MKRLRYVIFIMAVFLMMIASVAMANTISGGDYIQLSNYNPLDNAGIMTYNISHDGGVHTAFTYNTFCIQDNVYIYPNTWYSVASVSNQVGLKDSPLPDGAGQLNGAVDYLFYRYASGAYTGLLSTYADQADLQRVLWSLQGTGATYSSNGYLWDTDLINYNNNSSLHHSWGTEVINIVYNGQDIQNQLYNPDPVPEPSSLLLLGFGVSALILACRSRRAN